METIFYILGIAYFLVELNLLDRWYILASIAAFVIGKYIFRGMFYLVKKQFNLEISKNNNNPSILKDNRKNLIKNSGLEVYQEKIRKAMQDRLTPEKGA